MARSTPPAGSAPSNSKTLSSTTRSQNSQTKPNSQSTTGAAAFGVTSATTRNDRIGDAAEEPPDVVRRIRLDEQAEQRAAEQRVHQRRQNEVRQVIVPIGGSELRCHRRLLAVAQRMRDRRCATLIMSHLRPASAARQTRHKKSGAPKGPASDFDRSSSGQVFSSRTVRPRGLRISST